MDIQGPGAAVITVSGNNASRVFYLYNSDATIDVTISGLTITGGNATIGAGIVDFGENLTLDQVTVTGNTAAADGAGLWASGLGMNLTVRDSTFSGNTAGSDGGAIYVDDGGPLLIQRTVITGNDAADDGGGIYFYDPDDSVTIEDSTISGNSAGGAGGGIYVYDTDGGTHTIRGTTISGNDAQVGGGIFLYGPDDPFSIENSTISGNQATAGDGGGIFFYSLYAGIALRHVTVTGNSASGTGGGIFTANSTAPIDNSIVANNTAATGNDLGNGSESDFDVSFSLIEDQGTADINDNGGNIFNQDPQLGPLQNNGGPTQTHLQAVSSPVIDAGNSEFTVDQRGQGRPVGTAVDMGAVEVAPINSGTIALTASTYSVNENGGTVTITATRTGGSDGAVSVSYATSDGTAIDPADFLDAAGTLNWADGDAASKTFQVTIVNDLLDEADETFGVALSNPQGATLGTPSSAEVTILDDDLGQSVTEIPTLGDLGKVLLGGFMALAGFLLLRRR